MRAVYGELYIPVEVHEEVQAGLDEGYAFYQGIEHLLYPLADNGWIRLTSLANNAELSLFARLPVKLHSGESACIAIAHHRHWLFLTDDLAARKEAQRLEVIVFGSLGCLMAAVEMKYCAFEEANTCLQHMLAQGYRSPVQDLTQLKF